MLTNWDFAAVLAAFLASLVEAVEAFTIVLAVDRLRGHAPALAGAAAGFSALAALVLLGGQALDRVPLHPLQFVVGLLLLAFGLMWLRKAVLRSAGLMALRDEVASFAREQEALETAAPEPAGFDWLAAVVAGKAVLLEGLEVIFIVLAVGAAHGRLASAGLGAAAACLLVVAVGMAVRRPLSRVPENALKYAVGVMLTAFGVLWTGEGLGLRWPAEGLAFPLIAGAVLAASLAVVLLLRRQAAAGRSRT